MINIEELTLRYFSNEEPVPYLLDNKFSIYNLDEYIINISPISVKDWAFFECCLDVLMYQQQDYNDVDIVSSSYLKFLSNYILPIENENKDKINEFKLRNILYKSCGIEYFSYGGVDARGRNCINILSSDGLDSVVATITAKEFDEIKKIILFQNIPNYDDRYISPDVKELMAEMNSIKNKDVVNPTLEKKKIFVISKTGFTMKEINEMTYRTFVQIYKSNVDIDIYFANKILQASEKYKVEDVIYPLYAKEKDALAELFSSDKTNADLGISI